MKRIVTVCNEIDFEKLVNPTGRFVMGGSFADCGATGRKSAYAIGVVEAVSMAVDCFGSEYQNPEFIRAYVRENYDLTPRGIVRDLHLLDVDYNAVSAYGYFSKGSLPWEE